MSRDGQKTMSNYIGVLIDMLDTEELISYLATGRYFEKLLRWIRYL
jgi:hypothetical protein